MIISIYHQYIVFYERTKGFLSLWISIRPCDIITHILQLVHNTVHSKNIFRIWGINDKNIIIYFYRINVYKYEIIPYFMWVLKITLYTYLYDVFCNAYVFIGMIWRFLLFLLWFLVVNKYEWISAYRFISGYLKIFTFRIFIGKIHMV